MKRNETFTIVLESKEERDRLAQALYNHYEWQSSQGEGEESDQATLTFKLFQDLSGCMTLQEYRSRKELHLDLAVSSIKRYREEGNGSG